MKYYLLALKSGFGSKELDAVDGEEFGGKFNKLCPELLRALIKLDFQAMYGKAAVFNPDGTDVTDKGGENDDARKADADKKDSDEIGGGGRHLSGLWLPSPRSSCIAKEFLWGKASGNAGACNPRPAAGFPAPTPSAENAWGPEAKFIFPVFKSTFLQFCFVLT